MFAQKIGLHRDYIDIIQINSCDSVCVQIFTNYESDYKDDTIKEICV